MEEDAEGRNVGYCVVHLDDLWVKMMKSRMQKASNCSPSHTPTINRVPESIRQVDKETTYVYDPYMVSIGPYHHGEPRLQAMEEHKWRYLHDYLSRNPDNSLEYCLEQLKAKEAQLRSQYSEVIELESNGFVEMMVLDGCFIVEYLVKQMEAGDPLLDSTIWFYSCLLHDMLLLENQIPFSILQWLYDQVEPLFSISFSKCALTILNNTTKLNDRRIPEKGTVHLLHLYHSYLMPTPESENSHFRDSKSSYLLPTLKFMSKKMKQVLSSFHRRLPYFGRFAQYGNVLPSQSRPPPLKIPSATELHDAGVRFVMKKSDSFLEVKFCNGVMRIPPLSIDYSTYSIFKNIIAWEQSFLNSQTKFTNYAVFMDLLINTAKDVELLYKKEIILHSLGSHEEVAVFFNNLCKEVGHKAGTGYLSDLFKEVTEYYGTTYNTWRASLKRDYFGNPWTVISLVAAFILLSVTITQTVFSILAYRHS